MTHNLSDMWGKYFDLPVSTRDTVSCGGYYVVEVMEGLKLISFNSNYEYVLVTTCVYVHMCL